MLHLLLGALVFDPAHPDRPLVHCGATSAFDPTASGKLSPPTRTLSHESQSYGITMAEPGAERVMYPFNAPHYIQAFMRQGDIAYDNFRPSEAVKDYEEAASALIRYAGARASRDPDTMLRLARVLSLLGDRPTAMRLWRASVRDTTFARYRKQTQALLKHAYPAFFRIALSDRANFTNNHLSDLESGGVQWIYAGFEAGAAGRYARARVDFQEALNCGLWYATYAEYGWAAASYALGDTTSARQAFLAASVMGDSSPGDMPFYSSANAAAATMLLSI